MPLIVETLLLVALFYLIGVVIGRLIFRPKRETYL